jgi:hypothetical protein
MNGAGAVWKNLSTGVQVVFVLGLALRISAFVLQGPYNNDPHGELAHIYWWTKRIPLAHEHVLAFHPPLYYVLGALTLAISGGSIFCLQLISLVCSCLNLWVLLKTIQESVLLSSNWARMQALCVCAFLPQFVLFGNYVSNDSLSFLFGSLVVWQLQRYWQQPNRQSFIWLMVWSVLGLLTKGTFLAVIPVVLLVVMVKQSVTTGLPFVTATFLLGGFKYAQNWSAYSKPFVTALDFNAPYAALQRPTFIDWASYLSCNIFQLLSNPYLGEATRYSPLLVFYGTFWQQWVPESQYFRHVPQLAPWIPVALYVLGLLLPLGLLRAMWRHARDGRIVFHLGLIVALTAIAFVTGWRYDIWSWFQGRYVFTVIGSLAVVSAAGWETLPARRAVQCSLGLLWLTCIGYLAVEMVAELHRRSQPMVSSFFTF